MYPHHKLFYDESRDDLGIECAYHRITVTAFLEKQHCPQIRPRENTLYPKVKNSQFKSYTQITAISKRTPGILSQRATVISPAEHGMSLRGLQASTTAFSYVILTLFI